MAIKDICEMPATSFLKYSSLVNKTHNSWDESWSWFCFSMCKACLSKCFPLAPVSAPLWHFREHNGTPLGRAAASLGWRLFVGRRSIYHTIGFLFLPQFHCAQSHRVFLKLCFELWPVRRPEASGHWVHHKFEVITAQDCRKWVSHLFS